MAVTGQIGDADVRLENAAEEATMQKILEALGGINESAKNGNTGLGSVIKKAGPLGVAMGAVTGSFSLLGKAITGTVKGLGHIIKAGNAVVGFSAGLVQSQTEITGFTEGLKDSKLNILGFGDSIHAITKLLYTNYTTFQQLSTSGIAFGGRLEEMQSFASGVGINLDQLSGNLASNSEQLARLGTGTRGATMAIELAERAFLQNEAVLQRYGLSFAEQNENFLRFFAQNSLSLQRGTMSQEQLIDMSDDYAKGLRRLSEITGQQADQLEEGYQKAAMNTAFDNFISQFDGATQQRLKSVINTMQAGFGDAGRESAMAMMMGVNPVTEGAQQLTTMMPGFGSMLSGLTNNARNFNGSLEDFNNSMYGQMNQFANANRSFADANSSYFGTLAMMGDPYGMAGGEIVRFVNMFGGSMEQMTSRLGEQSPVQEAINTFNRAIRDVRDALSNLFTDVFGSPSFVSAMDTLKLKIPTFKDKIVEFIDFFRNYDYDAAFKKIKEFNPFTEEGRQKIIDGLGTLLAQLTNIIVERIGGGGSQTTNTISQGGTPITDMGDIRGMLFGFGGIDPEDFLEEARMGVLTDIASGVADFFGMGRGAWFRKNLESMMEANPELSQTDAKNQLVEAIRSFVTNQQAAGTYTADEAAELMRYINDDLRPIIDDINVRQLGTLGATGSLTEPRNMLAKIHAGERVLNAQEAADYNAMTSQPTVRSGGLNSNLVNRLLDETRENRVNLTNALNMLHGDMREMIRKQELTTAAIADYS